MLTPEFRYTFDGAAQDEAIIATYALEIDAEGDVLSQLRLLARFVYPGTGNEVAGVTPDRWQRHAARILGIYEVPPHETERPPDARVRRFVAQIAFPTDIIGDNLTMLMTAVAGEIQAYGRTKLIDLFLPERYIGRFISGPKHGVEGVRGLLNVPNRPLLLAIYKPSQGFTPEEGAATFYEVAAGGADIVKDDELLSDPGFCRRAERVRLYMAAEKRVFEETGEHTLYAVNITDQPDRLLANALEAIDLGASALMVNYVQVGLDAARMVCEDRRVTVPVLGHNSGATSLYASPNCGLSTTLINAKLPRLCGLDICIFLTDLGKFPMLREHGILIVREMLSPLYHVRPILPVAAGGVTPGRIDIICSQYGHDIAVGAGGTIFGHPHGPRAGARAFRQAIDAVMEARDIADAAREHPELGAAVVLWDPARAAK